MTREKENWFTEDTYKNLKFQTNQYEEVRILNYSKVFITFSGEDCVSTARRWWNKNILCLCNC